MALDDREYSLSRRGWHPGKLTGFRKPVEIYNPKEFRRERNRAQEFETLPEVTSKEIDRHWKTIFTVLWISLFIFTAWTIWH